MKDSSQSKFIVSSAKNPCPICDRTKDGDCRINDDVVLCHTSIDADVQKDGYVYRGATDCGMWGQYFPAVEPIPKAIRPKATKEFFYSNPDGSPLVRVTRKDDGNGKKTFSQSHWNGQRWVYGLTDEAKARVHLYRIFDLINQQAIANNQPIFIAEGEGVADTLISLGIPATTAIGGAGKWQRYGYQNYIADFKGAQVVICPDRDKKGLQHAEAIAKDFPDAPWCYAIPESPLWERIPDNSGIDTGDWAADLKRDGLSDEQVRDRILAAVELRRDTRAEIETVQSSNDKEEIPRPALARRYEAVKRIVGDRLKLNALTKELELNGQPLEIEELQLSLAVKNGVNLPDNQAGKILGAIGKENIYNPVVEYLQGVKASYGNSAARLDELCREYLSTDNPLHTTYLRKFLIAAVARAFEPGCKVDTALILQGKQGIGKSSFFKVLASEDWFDDSLGNVSDKDERLKLHKVWFCEWAELESIFKRRDISQVKAFLTSSRDLVRPPYGRSVVSFARTSVIVGSTNENEFLSDSTGNRRFWVIPVKSKIDLKKLATERDQIWAAAVAAYENSESWWLTDQEEEFSSALVSEFQIKDPWQAAIEFHVATLPKVTTSEIINQCLKLPIERQTRGDEMRVANVLKQLGWVSKVARENKRQVRTWFREILPDSMPEVAAGCHIPEEPLQSKDYSRDNPCDNLGSKVVTPPEVVTPSNPSGCDNLDPLLQPVTTCDYEVVTPSNLDIPATLGECDNLIQPQTLHSKNQSKREVIEHDDEY